MSRIIRKIREIELINGQIQDLAVRKENRTKLSCVLNNANAFADALRRTRYSGTVVFGDGGGQINDAVTSAFQADCTAPSNLNDTAILTIDIPSGVSFKPVSLYLFLEINAVPAGFTATFEYINPDGDVIQVSNVSIANIGGFQYEGRLLTSQIQQVWLRGGIRSIRITFPLPGGTNWSVGDLIRVSCDGEGIDGVDSYYQVQDIKDSGKQISFALAPDDSIELDDITDDLRVTCFGRGIRLRIEEG